MRLLVRGGRVVDPSQDLDGVRDILIEDGRVKAVEEPRPEDSAAIEADEVVDAGGLVVAPGFLDMHVHLREPGFEYKETVRSGVLSAAAGGFTGVACMANTLPVHDHRSVTELILREADRHPYARVHPIGAVTRGLAGEELAEIGDMVEAGVVAISDDGLPVRNAAMMRRALRHARHYDIPVIQHAEDLDLTADGVMHEGEWSTRLGLPGIPGCSEDVVVARDLILAHETGSRYHVAHLSTALSLALVREARRRGVRATCEVTPHHLVLTDRAVADSGFSTSAKMKPPLRSQADLEALIEGLQDGTVDAIASDHAPHHPDEKDVQFSVAPFGILGLETTVSLCLDRLVRPGLLDLARLIELLAVGPARILGLESGSLAPGRPADLTFLDLEREVTVDPESFFSKSRNSPFGELELRGAPAGTIVGGRRISLPDR